jgi:hemerythrin-like metal-binding protein
MPLFEWNDKFSVEVKKYDEQHKNLIKILNDLYDAMKVGKGADVMGEIFGSLLDYTKYHFNDEEETMRKLYYDEYLHHKAEHDKLTVKVLEYKKKFENNEILISVELLNFLRDWLTNHIMKTDRKYGNFFKENGMD